MKLMLVRHAEAVNIGEAGATTDFSRTLTEHGHEQAKALAHALIGFNVLPGIVMTSPYLRAVQTAEHLTRTLTPGSNAKTCDYLKLEELKPRKLAKDISETRQSAVVLVGHMPDMGRLAGWLLGCSAAAISFEKSAAALIVCGKSVDKGRGELRWLATPDWFM